MPPSALSGLSGASFLWQTAQNRHWEHPAGLAVLGHLAQVQRASSLAAAPLTPADFGYRDHRDSGTDRGKPNQFCYQCSQQIPTFSTGVHTSGDSVINSGWLWVLRLIKGWEHTSYSDSLKEFNLFSLSKIRLRHVWSPSKYLLGERETDKKSFFIPAEVQQSQRQNMKPDEFRQAKAIHF